MGFTAEFLNAYNSDVLMCALPPTLADNYTVLSCLKSGETRDVFLLSSKGGDKYILKSQPAGRTDSLQNEFKLLEQLKHPGLPRATSFTEQDGREYFIRDYIPGRSVYQCVVEQGKLTIGESVSVARSLCSVLQYLHELKPSVIHRDIKPQNVILTESGGCALIDFGIARQYKETEQDDTVFMGTKVTAPPEQFGYQQTSTRSDLYSVGMLLRFMLSGSYEEPLKTAVPHALRKVISRCTAFDPKHRYRSALELNRALWMAVHQKSIKAVCLGALAATIALCVGVIGWSVNRGVHFESPLLEQAVRVSLGLPEGVPIPTARLTEVTELVLCGQTPMDSWQTHEYAKWDRHDSYKMQIPRGDIADLSELKRLPNLTKLALDYQQITDVSPLAALPLEQLSLCANRIGDLAPLGGAKSLTALYVSDNPLRNDGGFEHFTNLQRLNLNGCGLTSLDGLVALPLEELRLRDTGITDYKPLQKLPWLAVLETGVLSAESLVEIGELSGLKELSTAGGTHFSDFTDLGKLQNLQVLNIPGVTCDSLEGLQRLSKLKVLRASYVNLRNLEPLADAPMLETLQLSDNLIEDFTPLLRCKNLRLVRLDTSQGVIAESQLVGAPFQIETQLRW